MAEAIIRQHKRPQNRWMPKEKRRFAINWEKMAIFAGKCAPSFFLAFAEVVGIPSGLYGALGMACAVLSLDARPILAGGAAALALRLVSGLTPHWELLLTLAAVAAGVRLLPNRGIVALVLATLAAVLPVGIIGCFAPTAAEMLQGWAAVAVAGLSAPVFTRAIKALRGRKHIAALEERVAVGYLAAMCLCGGARMLFLGFNVGVWMCSCVVSVMALTLGTAVGALAGMLAGVVLSLQGLSLTVAVALSMGGFLAGMSSMLSRKVASGAFAMGAYLPLLLCDGTGLGCGAGILGAALMVGLLPREKMERVQQFFRRFLQNDPVPGDAYAASALYAWEQTVAAMARAVPSPVDAEEERNGAWWQDRLCQGCPEIKECGCMLTGVGITKAETVWSYRHAKETVWQGALEHLRGMGCQRLYHLFDSMNMLRQEDEVMQRSNRQMEAQRNMLVTHLTAMSGAARRFAVLSAGETWWDNMAARRIRRELDERAVPVSLSWVRRVKGHAQAAYELQSIAGARKQADELIMLTSVIMDVPMELAAIDGDRVLLTEQPILKVDVGIATEPITGGKCCGDTAWSGILQDGRCLVALCDGMGHGERAELASRQTVELLRLCLDVGYSRQQTLTAVNGMLLLGGGERFATADVLVIDLWKGYATLDKLGAAASWLCQRGMLTRFTGDALPLGILEEIELSGSDMRLHDGDAVILLTDGLEEAFGSVHALEQALKAALEEESPQDAAEALIAAALDADGGQRRDDESVVVVYVRENRRHK